MIEMMKSITPIVSLFGIAIAAYVAIINIRKAAKESRASTAHINMIEAVIEIVSIFRKTLMLLGNVSNKITHKNRNPDIKDETALERYWKEIGGLTQRHEIIAPHLQLFLPVELFKLDKKIINGLNQAREIVASTNPLPNDPEVDTSELTKLLEDTNTKYFQFLEDSRSIIGTNTLDSIGKKIDFNIELYGSGSKSK